MLETPTSKICKDCDKDLCLSLFNKNPNGILKVEPRCKKCQSLYNKAYREKNRARISEKNRNSYKENREVIINRVREYAANNKQKISSSRKRYYNKNKERILEQAKSYVYKKRKEDPIYKLKMNLRHRLSESLKKRKWSKNTHFYRYIGCDLETLKSHLESKFQPGMNWTNNTHDGWHVDHIIPLSSAKTEEDLYKLCHYTNLQPLWASDNLRKSDKYGV
jgi:hypothetical protein